MLIARCGACRYCLIGAAGADWAARLPTNPYVWPTPIENVKEFLASRRCGDLCKGLYPAYVPGDAEGDEQLVRAGYE